MRIPRKALHGLELLLAASLALAPPSRSLAQAGQEPIAVVVSEDWPGRDRIDLRTLRRLFLGRQTSVAGRRVRVFQPAEGRAVREAFEQGVLQRSARELVRYWIEQALVGGALPPRERGSDAELLEAVRSQEAAIGYLGLHALEAGGGAGLRMLGIEVGSRVRHPGDPDYPLQAALAEPP